MERLKIRFAVHGGEIIILIILRCINHSESKSFFELTEGSPSL